MKTNNENNTEKVNILSNGNLTRLFNPIRIIEGSAVVCDEGLTAAKGEWHECDFGDDKKPNEKTYKLTDETIEFGGHTLHRIQCIEDFTVENNQLKDYLEEGETADVKKGELGGFVESYDNLSGNAWVNENAKVYGKARVCDSAIISGNAVVCDNAVVKYDAIVYENAVVYGNAVVYEDAIIAGNANIFGNARIYGHAKAYEEAQIHGEGCVYGYTEVYGHAEICGKELRVDGVKVGADALLDGNGYISNATIDKVNAKFRGDAYITGNNDFMCFTNVGSRLDILTAYRTKHNGVRITVGCFFGDLAEFRKEVAKKNKESESIIKNEYLMIADIIQQRFIDNDAECYLENNKIYES